MMVLMVRQAAGSRGEDCGGLVEACLCVQKFRGYAISLLKAH